MGQLIPAPLLRLAKVLEHVHQLKKKREEQKTQTAAPGRERHKSSYIKRLVFISLLNKEETMQRNQIKVTLWNQEKTSLTWYIQSSFVSFLDVVSDCQLSLVKMTHVRQWRAISSLVYAAGNSVRRSYVFLFFPITCANKSLKWNR